MICAKDEALAYRLLTHGISGITPGDARILRLAQLTLRKWAEEECNGTIRFDEEVGCYYIPGGREKTYIKDKRERPMGDVFGLCVRLDIFHYHQSDPRGCSLYVSHKPLNSRNYTDGVACIVG